MIKGILSLFTSGAIFNPMILLGIALGIFCMTAMKEAEVKELFFDYHLYLLVLLISTFYSFTCKKIYQEDGIAPDYFAMGLRSVFGVIKFTLAALLMMSFISLISF